MITIFSPMRPFHGEIGEVQLNAIKSWLAVKANCEVLLIDDEESTTTAATQSLGVRVIKDVNRSPMGAPLLDDLMRVGAQNASHPVLAYITADVMLSPNLADVALSLDAAMRDELYFAIAARHDLRSPLKIDFDAPDWFDRVRSAVKTQGSPHGHTALDLWIFRRDLPINAPPMPIGRFGSDGWAIWEMRRRGVPVVDVTDDILIVHQFHGKPARRDPRFHTELLECVRLFERMPENAMTLLDAEWKFTRGCLQRPTGLRRLHSAMAFFKPYRFLVGQRRRWNLPHIYGSSSR